MRVYAISDVHTDYRDNLQLLTRVARYPDDALILAGDVSDRLSILRQTFSVLLERFRYVFYVPGNHEMWIRGGEYEDSLQKFHGILELCASLGVRTRPECVQDVSIVPLFSWYTRPEEGSDSLFRDRSVDEIAKSAWTDDYLVKWPPGFRPAQFFHDLNEPRVSASYGTTHISFSHFMPRADLMFATPDEPSPRQPDPLGRRFNFSRVAGSTLIEEQIRKLDSRVHVYGHQHRNRCRHYEGIWYVSNCLGYLEERDRGSVLNPETIVRPVWPVESLK
jgi:hypothetical protein